jgi:hypothetical protein
MKLGEMGLSYPSTFDLAFSSGKWDHKSLFLSPIWLYGPPDSHPPAGGG